MSKQIITDYMAGQIGDKYYEFAEEKPAGEPLRDGGIMSDTYTPVTDSELDSAYVFIDSDPDFLNELGVINAISEYETRQALLKLLERKGLRKAINNVLKERRSLNPEIQTNNSEEEEQWA